MARTRLYLDNSATSFPKAPGVIEAMADYATRVGASPGRGQYAESREGARIIRDCRERIARLINAEAASHVVFTLNTSDALNLAIKGVVRARRLARRGDSGRIHVVTTAMDHNSVLRPLAALAEDGDVEVTRVAADPVTGRVAPASICHAIRRDTALVAMVHASNVGGTIQPVAAVGAACRAAGVPFLVDAAQSLGHAGIDVRAMGIDLLAFPGHKGLLGPQGTGGLSIDPGVLDRVATTREGGTGSIAELDEQPTTMPERFEAGSHNTAGIAGLSVGVGWLLDRGIDAVRTHELAIIGRVLDGLRARGVRMGAAAPVEAMGHGPLRGMRLLGPDRPEDRVAVFSMTHDELEPSEVAAALESDHGILVRAGIHCAPRAHDAFGTLGDAPGAPRGAFRFSFGPFNTDGDVDRLLVALEAVGAPRPTLVAR